VWAVGPSKTIRAAVARHIALPALPYPKADLGQLRLDLFGPGGNQ
jgi:hypothetical protein